MSFTVVDAEQRSDAWKMARLGRLTGSVAGEMLAKVKTGEAAGRRNLRLRLVLERLTGKPQEDGYVSPAMQAGIDREADAFAAYEALTGDVVERSGFLAHDRYMAGASLDGHMANFTKLLSIKCRQPAAHLDVVRTGKVSTSALAQIRHEMWITGALEHDYFSFNPDFKPSLQTSIVTIKRADAAIPEYEALALQFLAEVDSELAEVDALSIRKGVAA